MLITIKKSMLGALLGLGLIVGAVPATAIAAEPKLATAPSYDTQSGELRCGVRSGEWYCEIVIRW